MIRRFLRLVTTSLLIVVMGACGNNAWEELPSSIVAFVTQYFPYGEIQSYTESSEGSVVKVKNGATLAFDKNYAWTDVNGNGVPLPGDFLFDQLPGDLYDYIESIEGVGDVYRVSRRSRIVTVEMLDNTLTYDEITGTITYPAARG